jgi:hypothetical protein
LTTGEISADLANVYGAPVSKDTVSRITDLVIEENRGLPHAGTLPPSPGLAHLLGAGVKGLERSCRRTCVLTERCIRSGEVPQLLDETIDGCPY